MMNEDTGLVETLAASPEVSRTAEQLRGLALAAAADDAKPARLTGADLVAEKMLAEAFTSQLATVLPPELDARTLTGDAMLAVYDNPDLAACPVDTILGGVASAAQLGLRIGVQGHSWLVPRWSPGGDRAVLMIGYQGWLELAYRSGLVKSVAAFAITKDEWEQGKFRITRGSDGDTIHHEPLWMNRTGEPSQEIGWYARIVLTTGGHICPEPWNAVKMRAHKEKYAPRARFKDDSGNKPIVGPWRDFPLAMARKTVLLDALKTAPKSPAMGRAMVLDGAVRHGVDGAARVEPTEDGGNDE